MAKKKVTFAGAMSKVNEKTWKKAREVEPGGERQIPVIEDGVYPAIVASAKADTSKDGKPYVTFNLTIKSGNYEGTKLEVFQMIKEDQQEEDLARVTKSIKSMGYKVDETMSAGEFIESVVEDINDKNSEQPQVLVKVENDAYEAKSGKKKGQLVKALKVYINRPLSAEEMSAAAPAKGKGKAAAKSTAAPKKKAARK